MAGGRRDRGQFGRRNLPGATMWLEVVETDDSVRYFLRLSPPLFALS